MKVFKVIVYLLLAGVVIWAGVNFFSASAETAGQPVELLDSTATDVDTTVSSADSTVTE